jgi:voltage-gated potassium channel Kch
MSDGASEGPRFPGWEARTRRAVARRRVFPFLVLCTTALGLLAGFLATLLAPDDFPTFGTGVWWAIVTLGTVGYGDVVPHTAWGRVLGGVLIVVGVTFLAFLIAIVTSYFVSADEQEKVRRESEQRESELVEAMAALRRIEARLDAIEARLGT